MGFGGGALVASPLSTQLLKVYGGAHPGGAAVEKLFITFGIRLLPVHDDRCVPGPGAGHPAWTPIGFDPASVTKKSMVTTGNGVSAANAIKTPSSGCCGPCCCAT